MTNGSSIGHIGTGLPDPIRAFLCTSSGRYFFGYKRTGTQNRSSRKGRCVKVKILMLRGRISRSCARSCHLSLERQDCSSRPRVDGNPVRCGVVAYIEVFAGERGTH
jgi:hypothetical protein